ncbi:hypothetical protein [Parvularcula lutaonensis]|uniref:DNA helicase n=1 Tax=Parvularcula lutaonensis TaxID=491923 RepID=A0ABV7M895_9PROT|nr:hypothetical protein [Parvularcula lutaonensis]GGY43365.1 hypothetical protein GCM10007148_10130 [Parvularcula lutaonensis]
MNAAPQPLSFNQERSPSATGVVAAVSAVHTLVAMPADRARDAGVTVGTYLEIEGDPRAIAVIRGVETPAADADADSFELVIIEAELVGRLSCEGIPQPQPCCPAVGARATILDREAALGEWQSRFAAPVPLGAATCDTSLLLDAQRLLAEGLEIVGDSDQDTGETLAVVVRALLRQRFPARLVFLDADSRFTASFGRAASIVDCNQALLPAGLLTSEEMRACLEAFDTPLTDDEWYFLRMAQVAGERSLKQLIAAFERERGQAGAASHDAYASLLRRLRDARDDERLALFFGEAAEDLTPEAILQRLFRLPDGRPPMAVCQLGDVDDALKPVAARVILRLSRTLGEQAAGRVPVLLAIDGCDDLFTERDELSAVHGRFAVVRSAGYGAEASSLCILHRHAATIARLGEGQGAEADIARECSRLEPGEALLLDPKLPWPQPFTVDPLPQKAIPSATRRENASAEMDVQALLNAVVEAFASPAH